MLTVLLLIIFGIIDFGRLLFASQSMKAASREGARAAAVGAASGAATTVGTIQNAAASSGDAGAALAGGSLVTSIVTRNSAGTVIATPAPPCSGAAENVEVIATTAFEWFTPTGFFAGSIDEVSSSTTMRCE